MTKLLSVVETPAYLSKASKLLNENERAAVVDMIAAAPNLGVVMRGTGGLRWQLSQTHSWQILEDEGEEEGFRWFDARASGS